MPRLIVTVVLLLRGSAEAKTLDEASTDAYKWMVSTKTPSGFYLSQIKGDPCYTYDQAVTVVAFLIKGDTTRARELLEVLQSHQGTNGSWYEAYDADGKVADDNQEWLGPEMWIDIACANYKKATGLTTFDAMARKNIDYLLKTQSRNGALKKNQGQGAEENADAYAALMSFGYTAQAAKVASFINSLWSTSEKRFNAGRGDDTIYLDAQTWPNAAMGPGVVTSDGPKALDFVAAKMACTKSNKANTFTVTGFDFNDDKDDVWLEGTAQMASAYYFEGRTADGDKYTTEVAKSQMANGAIPYSVRGGTAETGSDAWNMTTANALSSSAWFIIAVSKTNPLQPWMNSGQGSVQEFKNP